jgi:hypothetical protein
MKLAPSDEPTVHFVDALDELQGKSMLTVNIRQPSHEFTFGVGITFVSYSLVLTPVV